MGFELKDRDASPSDSGRGRKVAPLVAAQTFEAARWFLCKDKRRDAASTLPDKRRDAASTLSDERRDDGLGHQPVTGGPYSLDGERGGCGGGG